MADANEIERIKAARCLVAAPLIITLSDICSDLGRADLARRIKKTLTDDLKVQQNICIRDDALHGLTMRAIMSKVPSGYRLDTAVPHGFEAATRKMFPIFITAASAFWAEWRAENAGLCAQLRELFGTPAEAIPLYATETAMYWSRDHPYWVGIVIVFADASGHEYK
jgi:hypothetical protein